MKGHYVPCNISFSDVEPFNAKTFFRAVQCNILIEKDEICQICQQKQQLLVIAAKRHDKNIKIPAKKNAPFTHPNKKILALEQRCKQLEKMKNEIEKKGVIVDSKLDKDMSEIISENIDLCTPFQWLMWDEQNKHRLSNPKGLKRGWNNILI